MGIKCMKNDALNYITTTIGAHTGVHRVLSTL